MIIYDKNRYFYTSTRVNKKKYIFGFGTKNPFDIKKTLKPRTIISLDQIHSDNISVIKTNPKLAKRFEIPKCDGVIVAAKKVVVTIKTADCLPIIAFDHKKNIIAIVHCGWRGTLNNLVSKILRLYLESGSAKENITFFFGPSIGICCYEIKRDLFENFKKIDTLNFNDCSRIEKNKYFISLARINYFQLIKAGIEPFQIETTPLCTKCRSDRFFSHRRGDRERRMVNFIMNI